MTCVRRNLNNRNCCNSWQKGIRTINNQYPDDNREFEIAAGNGISVVPITAGILITNTSAASSFIEGRNIDIVPSGGDLEISVTDEPEFDGLTINGTSTFNGNIIQNGAAYETHAEKIYTTNDYVIMRYGAVGGLGAGDFSGFQVKLYDGVNDGRLVIDNTGTARVGDVGDEQPFMTRDESADLTDGDSLVWDAANSKAVTRLARPMIMAYKGIVGTPFSNSVVKIGLSDYVTNDTDQDYFSFTNSEITVKKSGLYRINYQIYGTPSGATRVQASYGVNSEYEKGYMINYIGSGGSNVGIGGEDVVSLNANDIVFLTGWLSSSSITFAVSTASTNHLEIEYLE